jgi:antitoxin VapB
MQNQRRVRLFRNGRNQAIRIPRDWEMKGREAIIRKEGKRLIVEPLEAEGLLSVLAGLKPLNETFPDVDKDFPPLDDVDL